MDDMRNAYKILVGNPQKNKSLWRPIRKWVTDVIIVPRGIWCENVHWIQFVQCGGQQMAFMKSLYRENGEYLQKFGNCHLLKEDHVQWKKCFRAEAQKLTKKLKYLRPVANIKFY
jgi:hypothetical protein